MTKLGAKVQKTEKPILSIHLNAGNDTNGNPRRVFVVFGVSGRIIKVIDEGYRGSQDVEAYFKEQGQEWIHGGQFPTTATERKLLLRDFAE